jgi:hypothetical protein
MREVIVAGQCFTTHYKQHSGALSALFIYYPKDVLLTILETAVA